MSRKIKAINIEGRGEVTVKEVSVLGVWLSESKSDDNGDWLVKLRALAEDAVSPSLLEIATWYPSEQEQVLDAFLELNGSFLSMARKLKVDGLLNNAIEAMTNNFQTLFVDLSKAGMAQLSGIMDGASSSMPSNT